MSDRGEGKKARLRVVSLMRDPEGGEQELRHAHRGSFREDEGGIVLEYEDEQDGERARIELHFAPGRARMVRKGMTSAQLTFLPGQRTSSAYVTLYGEIPVMVDTRRVNVTRDGNGGELLLDYDVYVGGEMTARTELRVTWRV